MSILSVACPKSDIGLDFDPPRVSTVSPQALAASVSVTTAVVVTFTKAMRGSTLYDSASGTSDKVILVSGAVDDAFISDFNNLPLSSSRQALVVAALVSLSGDAKTVTLTPTAPLSGSTVFTILVHKEAADLNGYTLVDDARQKNPFQSTFTTASPTVATPVIPAAGATGVAPNLTAIRVSFSPTVQAATITAASFRLLRCGAVGGGSACADELVSGVAIGTLADPVSEAELRPSGQLSPDTVYKVSLTEAILSTNGSIPLTPLSYTFSTASTPDNTPPVISNVSAAPGETTCTITWTTDEGATSTAYWGLPGGGPDAGWTVVAGASADGGTAHTVSLSGLTVETDYGFAVAAADAVGNAAQSDAGTFRTVRVPVVINEVLADPPADGGDANKDGVTETTKDEFVEFVNVTDAGIDLGGWTLSDSSSTRFTFPQGTTLPAGRACVVFTGGNPAGKTLDGGTSGCAPTLLAEFGDSLVCVAGGSSIWNNDGDTVTLKYSDGGTVTQVTYGSSAGNDQSLTRVPELSQTGTLTKHTQVADAGGRPYSPGTRADGTPF